MSQKMTQDIRVITKNKSNMEALENWHSNECEDLLGKLMERKS